MCKYSIETQKKAKELRIIDDALFRLIAERKGVCQEILRTLLDDDSLEVIDAKAQSVLSSLERGVTLDALCKLKNGAYCNIEMQKTEENDDIKRARFHASIITSSKTPKSTPFKDIPDVKVIYISEYDALGNGQAVTHISRCQRIGDNYKPVSDGEDIIFANTKVKDSTKQSELLQLFLRNDSFQSKDYPELSDAMHHFKETEKGVDQMCASIETYANERTIDAVIDTCMRLNQSKEDTLKMVKIQCQQLSDDFILERITLLWDNRTEK